MINLEAIKYAEAVPDTLIVFLNGDTVMVKESLDELADKALAFRRKTLQNTGQIPPGDPPGPLEPE